MLILFVLVIYRCMYAHYGGCTWPCVHKEKSEEAIRLWLHCPLPPYLETESLTEPSRWPASSSLLPVSIRQQRWGCRHAQGHTRLSSMCYGSNSGLCGEHSYPLSRLPTPPRPIPSLPDSTPIIVSS